MYTKYEELIHVTLRTILMIYTFVVFGTCRGFLKQPKKDNPGKIQPLHTNSAMTGEYLHIGDLPNNIANPSNTY